MNVSCNVFDWSYSAKSTKKKKKTYCGLEATLHAESSGSDALIPFQHKLLLVSRPRKPTSFRDAAPKLTL